MGKGSRRRPSAISQSEFDRRWALAFGKHDRKPRKGNVKVRLKAIGGVKMQFDLNAARNLEKLATASSVGSGLRPNACGDGPSGLSARQEPGISATW